MSGMEFKFTQLLLLFLQYLKIEVLDLLFFFDSDLTSYELYLAFSFSNSSLEIKKAFSDVNNLSIANSSLSRLFLLL